MDTQNNNTEENSRGALIGSIVIVLVLLIGGLYILKVTKENYDQQKNTARLLEEAQNPKDPIVETLKVQSSSDELDSISNDIENTNLDYLAPKTNTSSNKK